ncbi:tRNA pseudouridine synthase 3 [Blyttiomyces sp. JEL0837]|nr:tRNA pseudouridine synthase 3 [Blyttiomyces sp. JEL0837]
MGARTDAGVASAGTVVSVWVKSRMFSGHNHDSHAGRDIDFNKEDLAKEYPYVQMINSHLPRDIRVLAWSPVSSTFSARRNCTHRSYIYLIPSYPPLNIPRMQQALEKLQGRHNFLHFTSPKEVKKSSRLSSRNVSETLSNNVIIETEEEDEDTIDNDKDTTNSQTPKLNINLTRTIHSAKLTTASTRENPQPYHHHLTFTAQSFLLNQVRRMTSILLLIGRNLEDPSIIDTMLTEGSLGLPPPQYGMVDPDGLILTECGYQDGLLCWYTGHRDIVSNGEQKGENARVTGNDREVAETLSDIRRQIWESSASSVWGNLVCDEIQKLRNGRESPVLDGLIDDPLRCDVMLQRSIKGEKRGHVKLMDRPRAW